MEIFKTLNNKVTKYLHDDGSETAIKHSFDKSTQNGGEFSKITNKFNVFISNSVGCPVKCKFCYLTTKKIPYSYLSEYDIMNNVTEAVSHQVEMFPELKNQYMKVSWMGMGDSGLDFQKTTKTTLSIMNNVLSKGLCKGIDNVDISTTFPLNIDPLTFEKDILPFDLQLSKIPKNPLRSSEQYIRFFYSLHSSLNETRNKLIPYSKKIEEAVNELNDISYDKVKVIIHHMFLDGINDTTEDINQLINLMTLKKMKNKQLRILRYNKSDEAVYTESSNFDSIVSKLKDTVEDLKVQVSPGEDVKAACGQFLLKKFEKCDS